MRPGQPPALRQSPFKALLQKFGTPLNNQNDVQMKLQGQLLAEAILIGVEKIGIPM
jgi:hypothetical protein